MKTILTLAAAILLTTTAFTQSTWEKITLTEKVQISFPAKPVEASPANGQKSFILKQADSTANYIVAVSDLQVMMGIDAATLETEMEKEESWEQAKNGFVASMGADAKLIKDEMTTVKGTRALKLVLERKNDKGGINTLTVLIFVNGTHSLNVMFNNRGGKADKKAEETFFNSIEIS